MQRGITPASSEERSRNELRPATFDSVVGQERPKDLMRQAIAAARTRNRPLDHVLLVAQSGLGKSTFSHVIANEMGVRVFELEAPISNEQLLALREQMADGDILKIEEIHQQAIMERRGKSASTSPEVLYAVMEDRVIPTSKGVLPFPSITVIGTTTDEGMLPDPFINRFPLRPRLQSYTQEQAEAIVNANCRALGLRRTHGAVRILARASRGIPREINNLVKNAAILTPVYQLCNGQQALDVLAINGITPDGLTPDMQAMLKFLRLRAEQVTGDGDVKYQASVNTIATAIGKSRDSKAVAMRVEPFLIERGFVQVGHGGRRLTDAGVERAEQLLDAEAVPA